MNKLFNITDILNTVAAIIMHLKITFPTSHHAPNQRIQLHKILLINNVQS